MRFSCQRILAWLANRYTVRECSLFPRYVIRLRDTQSGAKYILEMAWSCDPLSLTTLEDRVHLDVGSQIPLEVTYAIEMEAFLEPLRCTEFDVGRIILM